MPQRIFDCVLYSGEADVLEIRLREIGAIVDHVVLVEGDRTFSGVPREPAWNPNDPRFADFVSKVRHVVVRDWPETDDPWVREAWQRNAVLSGLPDAGPDDLVLMSDVDEIPRASAIRRMADDPDHRVFGLRLGFYYFYVDYRNVEGPEKAITWTVAARRGELDRTSPNDLRYAVRDQKVPARILDDGGWHFSYLMDEAGVRRKIAAFSHQEFNTPEFLGRLDVEATVRRRADLFDRVGFVWDLVDPSELPTWLVENRARLGRLFCPRSRVDSALRRAKALLPGPRRPRREPPMIVCPYVHAHEEAEIRTQFDLDGPAGRRLPFFAWLDTQKLGPERAFEHCWGLFPDRDIVIVHSDMAPMPGDRTNEWYDRLIAHRDALPQAGMIACNLFYPQPEGEPRTLQCAGGTYEGGTIAHLHGVLGAEGLSPSILDEVREVDWVTFGGVLIRREVIRACGAFDRSYKWAYVMDVDYCFEARLRGFRLYQVPSFLVHEENRSTREMLQRDPQLQQRIAENYGTFERKWRPFSSIFVDNRRRS